MDPRVRSSLHKRRPSDGENDLSTKVTMAFVATIIAMASPVLPAGNGNRDDERSYKSAQYCIPQLDELSSAISVYCRE
jgi:hypothetical protein